MRMRRFGQIRVPAVRRSSGSRRARRTPSRSSTRAERALILAGGALIGAGAGLVLKGTTGIVLEAVAPEERVAMTSTRIITALFGLSIPVVGAG
jgi:hypothetical protein